MLLARPRPLRSHGNNDNASLRPRVHMLTRPLVYLMVVLACLVMFLFVQASVLPPMSYSSQTSIPRSLPFAATADVGEGALCEDHEGAESYRRIFDTNSLNGMAPPNRGPKGMAPKWWTRRKREKFALHLQRIARRDHAALENARALETAAKYGAGDHGYDRGVTAYYESGFVLCVATKHVTHALATLRQLRLGLGSLAPAWVLVDNDVSSSMRQHLRAVPGVEVIETRRAVLGTTTDEAAGGTLATRLRVLGGSATVAGGREEDGGSYKLAPAPKYPKRIFKSFALKAMALMRSPFRRTIMMDPDVFFVRDPAAACFFDPDFHATGALFWKDRVLPTRKSMHDSVGVDVIQARMHHATGASDDLGPNDGDDLPAGEFDDNRAASDDDNYAKKTDRIRGGLSVSSAAAAAGRTIAHLFRQNVAQRRFIRRIILSCHALSTANGMASEAEEEKAASAAAMGLGNGWATRLLTPEGSASAMWKGDSVHQQESGVVVIDVARHLGIIDGDRSNALLQVLLLNLHARLTYSVFDGDKETFWLGFEAAHAAQRARAHRTTSAAASPSPQRYSWAEEAIASVGVVDFRVISRPNSLCGWMAHTGCAANHSTPSLQNQQHRQLLWFHGSVALTPGRGKWDARKMGNVVEFTHAHTDPTTSGAAADRFTSLETYECLDAGGARRLDTAERDAFASLRAQWRFATRAIWSDGFCENAEARASYFANAKMRQHGPRRMVRDLCDRGYDPDNFPSRWGPPFEPHNATRMAEKATRVAMRAARGEAKTEPPASSMLPKSKHEPSWWTAATTTLTQKTARLERPLDFPVSEWRAADDGDDDDKFDHTRENDLIEMTSDNHARLVQDALNLANWLKPGGNGAFQHGQ